MLGGADNPNGELPSYITGADNATNPMVSPLIEHMKENLRQQILDRAEQQRQESGQDGN
ncbi:hypothetical protein [Escherichia coli]|uniref:hypothetical protein n=1 Tax=Escherichia coli TaxID=562 RepID=UPI000A863BCD|nr:hypothetical protein [Escherichia coli]EFH7091858.1 hypothetical protein [Escherichia coli]EFL3126325.1 hypothetical protein [Escherichia coli]EIT6122394.1 hypothetical protein [Escherichia coli]EKP5610218.1 hypothetical protein [Escherichia coli]